MDGQRLIHRWNRSRSAGLILMVGLGLWCAQAVHPGEAPKPDPPAPPAEKKMPGDLPEAAPKGNPPGEEVPVAKPEDPMVAAILASKPTTPLEKVRASEILARLGRPDLAKDFLKQVLEAKLADKELADLGVQLGSVFFMRLAGRSELAPEALQLRDAVFGAMKARLEDPSRLQEMIRQLQDPSVEKRDRAIAGIREAHQAGAVALIQVLADPARQAEHPLVRTVLLQMGSDAVGPLLASLEAPEDQLQTEAASLLARLQVEEAVLPLRVLAAAENSSPRLRSAAVEALRRLGAQPPASPREVAELLFRMAEDYYTGRRRIPADLQGEAQLWQWDSAKGQPTAQRLPVSEVRRKKATQWARQAYRLLPQEPHIRILYLATMLEEAKYAQGLDQPLPEGEKTAAAEAASFGVEVLESALRFALESRHPVAATGIVEVLGRLQPSEAILRRSTEVSPIVQALRHGDRRLRMAALETIVRMRPSAPFPGSSYVVEALEFFAATEGLRRVLVVSAQSEACSSLAGYLADEGCRVDSVSNGRDALRLLLASPDYEVVWVDAALRKPEPMVLVQQIRRDARTADLLVGIFCNQEEYDRLRRLAEEDSRLLVFPRPYQAEAAKEYFRRMATMQGPEWVGFEQRQRQAAQAMHWLAELAQQNPKLYDLQALEPILRRALYVPHVSEPAAKVLARLGTPTSQKALVDLASRGAQPLKLRETAVDAFAQSVQKFGLLLTTAEIEHQYDCYNASRHLPAETQKLLGRILDVIESAASAKTSPPPPPSSGKETPKQ